MPRFEYREKVCHVGSYEVYKDKYVLVGKSITRPRHFRSMHTSHAVDFKEKSSIRVEVNAQDLRINHYVCKTKEEQKRREMSGDSWRSKIKDWNLCENEFVQVRDTEIIDRFGRLMKH